MVRRIKAIIVDKDQQRQRHSIEILHSGYIGRYENKKYPWQRWTVSTKFFCMFLPHIREFLRWFRERCCTSHRSVYGEGQCENEEESSSAGNHCVVVCRKGDRMRMMIKKERSARMRGRVEWKYSTEDIIGQIPRALQEPVPGVSKEAGIYLW